MPYQMSNGKWRATRMIHGRVKTKSFLTKAEAKKWEAEQSAETWAQQATPIPTVCWLDFATAYLRMAEERFSQKTWQEKKRAFRISMRRIPPETNMENITARHGLEVLQSVALISGNAANKVRKNLAAAWTWGKRYYGLPHENPFLVVERFPADQMPRYVPPEEDFWRVYEVADDVDKAFLLFLLHTGARRAEAFRLTWDDVDFPGRRIRLGTRKTAGRGMEYAWIPMTAALRAALGEMKARNVGKLVFSNRHNGAQYTARQHMMPLLCARAGVKPFGFHAIRHLAATILAYAGLDLPTVQAMLRHQSPTTTARYIKSLGIQADKIEAAFTKKEGAKVVPFAPLKKAICT